VRDPEGGRGGGRSIKERDRLSNRLPTGKSKKYSRGNFSTTRVDPKRMRNQKKGGFITRVDSEVSLPSTLMISGSSEKES